MLQPPGSEPYNPSPINAMPCSHIVFRAEVRVESGLWILGFRDSAGGSRGFTQFGLEVV